MKHLFLVLGIIVMLSGAVWALQGAYVLPATFMRGPSWVAIGTGVAVFGLILAVFGWRKSTPKTARSRDEQRD